MGFKFDVRRVHNLNSLQNLNKFDDVLISDF